MAGITDSPFRIICKRFGADVVFTEFVHIRGVAGRNDKTLSLLNYTREERPIIAQLFGYEPEYFAEAAKVIEELGFDGLDINMGCPARKVVGHGSGASLMKDPVLASAIVKSVVESVNIPVSVKTRLGYDSFTAIDFVKMLEDSGAKLVTVHGRTYSQGFGGEADYDKIARVADSVTIPVIGNGDVVDLDSYDRMQSTGVFGTMIGRGIYGRPWLFQEIKTRRKIEKSPDEIRDIICEHAKLVSNVSSNFAEFRKHLGWYLKGFEGARSMREKLPEINNLDDVESLLQEFNFA